MSLHIFEMTRPIDVTQRGMNQVRTVPWNAAQTPVTVSGTSEQSAAFAPATLAITLVADEACHVEFGANPTATTNSFPLAAGEKADFGVVPGHKVAVIEASS